MAANAGVDHGGNYKALVGGQSLTTQHAELFQSYIPGQPTGSMIVNPHSRSKHQQVVFSTATYDLKNDKYAPRALGYAAAKMSSSFPQGETGGSYCGSPPRARDKFIPRSEHADIRGTWFDHKKPSPTRTQGLDNVNDRVFLRGDPWVRGCGS